MRSTRRSLVSTVQCVWSSSGLASGPPSAACSSSASSGATASGITTPRPAQAGQVASRSGLAGRHRRAALGGQPHRAGAIDDAALAQLIADRRDDGHGQLGQLADLAHRRGLGARRRGQDVPDPGLALGQPDGRRDLGHNCVQIHALYLTSGGRVIAPPSRRR